MRVVVDRERCEGHGLCAIEVPEVFELGDDGDLIVLDEAPPDSLRIPLETAMSTCPTRAISIVET